MKTFLCVVVSVACFVFAAPRPMEALNRYNVILVHGAAPEEKGFESECNSDDIYDAYTMMSGHFDSPQSIASQLGGAAGMLGDYENEGEKKLTYWLDSAVFEDYQYRNGKIYMDSTNYRKSPYIYIQRSFANPAASPAHNAHEIGDRTWKGNDKCSVRRSLFEEAQEVRAEGQNKLQQLRTNGIDEYRTIPSRNILIAHSMGGVASHEYVTDQSVYNNDVDKMIALDSPHEGTGSLNMLLDMRDYLRQYAEAQTQYMLLTILGMSYCAIAKEPYTATITLWLMAPTFGLSAVERIVTLVVDKKKLQDDYGFKAEDSLTSYIEPGAPGISALIDRPFNENMPMIRLLGGKGGLTFSDPNKGFRNFLNIFIPEGVSTSVMNVIEQLEGDGSASAIYTNMVTGLALGVLGGIALQDVGTTLVPEWSSLADSTIAFNDPNADVKKFTYDAAMNANSKSATKKALRNVAEITGVVSGIIAADIALSAFPIIQIATKAAIATAGAALLGFDLAETGIADLIDSHENAKTRRMLDTLYSAKFSYSKVDGDNESGDIRLMEDFLYEKTFVNLGLFVSDSTLRAVEPGCYYEADKANKQCEVGLYGTRDSIRVIDSVVAVGSVSKPVYNSVNDKGDSVFADTLHIYGSFETRNYSDFRKSPLRFKYESDWSKMGVKIDRWEKVDGLTPEGKDTSDYVPIRHVERYEVPAIVVENFIEKYSFVVDDLMPHRLRQIRMNFNFQEEIAWECDIKKDPQADDACNVYKRTGGGQWDSVVVVDTVMENGKKVAKQRTLKTVKHPVLKNGQFDFNPDDYGYYNKLALQKDNQNTVTISTVNKIGLSNTQRFYYLFKATANMLQPSWPKRDVVVNKIKCFKAYASAIGYQGFTVAGADDIILPQFVLDSASPYTRQGMDMSVDWKIDMSRIGQADVDSTGKVYDKSSAYFTSKQRNSDPQQGNYLWKFFVDINNIASPDDKDSSNTYEVPFRVDRTAPVFTLRAENDFVNPSNDPFVARFTWGDSATTPDIRAMRLTLEQMDANSAGHPFTQVAEFPAMSDVASPDFAIQWNDTTRRIIEKKGDGFYRIKAYAVDYAVPDSAVFNKMDSLVTAIMMHPNRVKPSLWPTAADSVNSTTVYDTFFVDTKAPVMSDETLKGFSTGSSEYSKLSHPARKSGYAYATEDSLLEISYKITEPLNGRDSVPVTIAWQFIHAEDTSKADRAGDSLWIKNGDAAHGSWTEMAGLRLSDGDYKIRAVVRDQARNEAFYNLSKNLRVDKTAPNIESLVSTQLVYPDSVKNYSAKIVVNENSDIALNRTGMLCHYHVGGCGKETSWKRITDKVLKNDSVTFKLDSLDGRRGKCYLEVACIDAAGNVSVKTDLFYIGERTPVISSPRDSVDYNQLVAISGIAPPVKLADSSNTIYRLRYASVDSRNSNGSLVWETSNIFVVSALRDSSHRNISKTSQSNDAVLGYLDRKVGKDSLLEGTFIIELGVCAGEDCISGPDSLWKVDTSYVFLGDGRDEFFGDSLNWHFVKNRDTLHVGTDSLEISLYRSGMFNSSYFLRVYAEDAKHVGMFDESVSKAWRNPYYGAPKDTVSDSSAVWFYELDGKYHLQWNGLGANDSLVLSYDSAGFGKICESVDKGSYAKCTVRPVGLDLTSLSPFIGSYFEDFPELSPLSTVNHEMLVTGKSGHIVMTATEAFRLSRANVYADTTLPKMHVYFGENDSDGFYWSAEERVSSDTLNPLMMGWTVNPRAYGLTFVWNGAPETGMYPATGKMKIYAEATENISSSPHVFLDSAEVVIQLPNVKIALPQNLPDFILSKKDSALVCESATTPKDSCERTVLKLNAMIAKYGIKYRDAHVGIYVMNGSTEVAKLQDPATVIRANANDSAYQVRWNGKGKQNMAQFTEGDYTLLVIASPVDGSKADTARASFHVKYAETMRDISPRDPKNLKDSVPAIFISEAKPDSANAGMYRYEPIADYLVKANASGWMFPDSSLVNGIPLVGEISGTQQIYKYEPRRFSLALKRHRKELKLVIMAKLDVATVYAECIDSGVYEDYDARIFYYTRKLSFDGFNRLQSFDIDKHIGHIGSGRGLSGKRNNFLTVYAFLENQIPDFSKKDGVESIPIDTNVVVPIWKKSFSLPMQSDDNRYSKDTIPHPCDKDTVGCVVVGDSTTCVYGPKDDVNNTNGYDPNKKLFNVSLNPVNGVFYSDKGDVNNDCGWNDAARNERVKFNLSLEIPDTAYWNAPFGMDNLVNRTVRFDHTNKTIFGDGKNGYWKALQESPNAKIKLDVATGSYYDGNKWKYDRTYGLLTPFEVQYLPMYPASLLDGGLNTFLFADEDAQHMQSARFDMQFFAPKDEHDYFKVLAVNASIDSSGCDTMLTDVGFMRSISNGRECVASATSNDSVIKQTPFYLKGAFVEFYVGRNMAISRAKIDTSHNVDSIAYPATLNWRTQVTDSCLASGPTWNFANNGSTACYKYYDLASRIHYYYGDYTDTVWTLNFVRSDGFIKNMVNTPAIATGKTLEQRFKDSLDASKFGQKSIEISVVPSSQDYDKANRRFFVKVDTVTKMLGNLASDHVVASVDSLRVNSAKVSVRDSELTLSTRKDTLYFRADSIAYDIVYRKSEDTDTTIKVPVRPNKAKLPMNNILAADSHYINYNQWAKNVVLNSAILLQLDSSAHTHLKVSGEYPDSADRYVEFRPADSIKVKRPKELVEIRAYLKNGINYQLAYLNGNAFYAVPNSMLEPRWKDSIKVDTRGWYRLGWFDVNKLQGNTQFMLLWGDKDKTSYNFAKFDMIVGRPVDASDYKTVKSLFEEVSVTFPKNSVDTVKDVTVRTIDAKDCSFHQILTLKY